MADQTPGHPESAEPPREVLVPRAHAERVLRRAGLDEDEVTKLLDGLTFPATLDELERRGARFGLSTGLLTERMGGSP